MGIPDHIICLLRNLYAGQEATVRTGYGTTDWLGVFPVRSIDFRTETRKKGGRREERQ